MSWIHNAVILPLCEPERHRGVMRLIRWYEHFDSLERGEQEALQEDWIKRMLEHAYRTTAYYRRFFDEAGFDWSRWRRGDPIAVPELNRDLLRKHGYELRSDALSDPMLRGATTGGTTAAPVAIWRDVEALKKKTAIQFHLNRQGGYDQGTPVLILWGAERDLAMSPSWKWRLYEQVLMRRSNAGAGQINDKVLASFADKLNRRRPEVIFGYGGMIALFAEYLSGQKQAFHRPKRVIVTAEPVTNEARERMEEIFGCPVTEHYGSRDIGMVAAQCDAGHRLHFHPAACYPEFVYAGQTDDGPIYRLIITDLLNRGMPMIRYDTGDCVLMEDAPCQCGSWYPSVRKVLGRMVDNFILPDGSLVPGIAVTAVIGRIQGGFCHVRQLQLIQKSIQHLHVRYAAQGDAAEIEPELSRFCAEVDKLFQSRMRWSMERVEEIERERSGKMRFCISEVSAPGAPVAV